MRKSERTIAKKEKDRQRAQRNRDKKKIQIVDLQNEIKSLKEENERLLLQISKSEK